MVETADVDGRNARRDRNRLAVLDTVLELFREGNLQPTPEEVAERSSVSLRSVYRYYSDRSALLRAAMARHIETVLPILRIHAIGEGAFDDRLDRFLEARFALYEAIGPTARASRVAAAGNEIIRAQYRRTQETLREQIDLHFAPELAALPARERRAAAAAADTLTQMEALDYQRHQAGVSAREQRDHLRIALRKLLT